MVENEIWKKIPGIAPNYEVSNMGNVRNIRSGRNASGIYYLTGKSRVRDKARSMVRLLTVDGLWKSFTVYSLVAKCFVDNPNEYKYINHKDFNIGNDRADNLEWVENQFVCRHQKKLETEKSKKDFRDKMAYLRNQKKEERKKQIEDLRKKGFSLSQIASLMQLDPSAISRIIDDKYYNRQKNSCNYKNK